MNNRELAEQTSNEIADLFKYGFFNQRMVDDLTKIIQTKIELAQANEREACAKLCDGYQFDCASVIRARNNNRTKTSRDICGND